MTVPKQRFLVPMLVLAMAASAAAQVSPLSSALLMPQSLSPEFSAATPAADGAQPLLAFQDSDIKFPLQSLMDILRDHQHEGWVLAAYPDPNTSRPLIGAGFSLDVEGTAHPQRDPLNPHPFVEPSSAQLWQAAGLAPERLQRILDQYERNRNAWTLKKYRRKINRQTLAHQLTDEEATRLLRISAIQAIYNAKAYCRGFDQLTASQQMALSQLVFQMGVNLEEFVEFLGALNDQDSSRELAQLNGIMETDAEHWSTVQGTLIDSQWARRYSIRASTVIAMFDPQYSQEPGMAEQRVQAVLHPPIEPRRASRSTAILRNVSYRHSARSHGKKASRLQAKRKLT